MLSLETQRPNRSADSETDQPGQQKEKPKAEEMLLETKQVLTDLKPPPKARESVVNGARVRDSYSGLNQQADLVEQIIRENGQAHGISVSEMMEETTLAKNYVVDDGQLETDTSEKINPQNGWDTQLTNDLKTSQAIARGIPVAETIPQPDALVMAERVSNASPAAIAIAQGNGLDLRIQQALEIPLIQAIAQSQGRIMSGTPRPVSHQTESATFEETLARIRNVATHQVNLDSLVVHGGMQQSYSMAL